MKSNNISGWQEPLMIHSNLLAFGDGYDGEPYTGVVDPSYPNDGPIPVEYPSGSGNRFYEGKAIINRSSNKTGSGRIKIHRPDSPDILNWRSFKTKIYPNSILYWDVKPDSDHKLGAAVYGLKTAVVNLSYNNPSKLKLEYIDKCHSSGQDVIISSNQPDRGGFSNILFVRTYKNSNNSLIRPLMNRCVQVKITALNVPTTGVDIGVTSYTFSIISELMDHWSTPFIKTQNP